MAAQCPQVTSTFILYQKSYVQQINILTYLHVFIYQLAKWYPKSLIKNISIYIKGGIFPVNSFLHECLLRSFRSMSNILDGTYFTGHIHLSFRSCSIQLHNILPLLGQLVYRGGRAVWSSCLESYSAPLVVGLFSHKLGFLNVLRKVLKRVEGQVHWCMLEESTGVADTHTPGGFPLFWKRQRGALLTFSWLLR